MQGLLDQFRLGFQVQQQQQQGQRDRQQQQPKQQLFVRQ